METGIVAVRHIWFVYILIHCIFGGISKCTGCVFPKGDPNQIYVYLKLPVGTDVEYTDSVTQVLETRVYKVLGYGKW